MTLETPNRRGFLVGAGAAATAIGAVKPSSVGAEVTEDPEEMAVRTLARERAKRAAKKAQAREGGLMDFVRYFWDVLEPSTKFVEGWLLHDIARHLEAVSFGKIKRLLINVPPGSMKSLMTNCFWPAWEWGALNMPHLRYVSFAYSSGLTERDNLKFKKLITSEKYQELWGDRFELEKEGEVKITNNKTGSKFASSVKGVGTGERGDRVVIDDPHNVHSSESDLVRSDTLRWFRETLTDRVNNLDDSAIIIIMQRVHQMDVSGFILEEGWPYCHMMVPMEYESNRPVINQLGWVDPRAEDGDLAWPERFSPQAVAQIEIEKGAFAYAGQYQQRPTPRGGGVIQREWWQPYTPQTCYLFGKTWPMLPECSFTVLSLDTAQTEKKQNDPTGGVLLGVTRREDNGARAIILMWAWAVRMELPELIEKIEETCKAYRVNKVIIEDKANGHSVAQMLRTRGMNISNRMAFGKAEHRERADFGVQIVSQEGDKFARLIATQPIFQCGMVWAPVHGGSDNAGYVFKEWAERTLQECSAHSRGKHDDLADAMSQGLNFLRRIGLAQFPDEDEIDDRIKKQYKREERSLYPVV